jgi:hypothetical protein
MIAYKFKGINHHRRNQNFNEKPYIFVESDGKYYG